MAVGATPSTSDVYVASSPAASAASDATMTSDRFLKLLVVGLIFGLITAFVRPIVNLISLPLIVLTLGLMLLVVNALMLMLTSAISGGLNLGFHVDGFWTALFGSIVISLASIVLESIFRRADRT